MQIRFDCPHEGCIAIIEYAPLEQCGEAIRCPRCHRDVKLSVTDAIRLDQRVDRCAVCDGRELFVRKDFPQRLGLLIVVVFGVTAIYFFQTSVAIALAVLTAAVVLDLLIYLVIGKVTACYACRAEYRGGKLNSQHEGFDLAASEKY